VRVLEFQEPEVAGEGGLAPACVKVRQVALEGSAPWPDLPITPRSSQGGQGERTHW